MLLDLLKKVRIEGRTKLDRSLSLEKSLPIVIDKDGGDLAYLNSGGRSILFEYQGCAYRLKAVDPKGILTERVARSEKNKLIDVYSFYFNQKYSNQVPPSLAVRDKPFGVLTKEDAMREKSAIEILKESYREIGITPPYEYARTYWFQDGNAQNLYRLPSLDSDLRLEEFDQLMRERLNRCSPKKLKIKSKQIFKLYRRFLSWEGWNIGFLADRGLEPDPDSWMPQNFVISKHEDGYGLFRVDHTSTKRNEDYEPGELMEKILYDSGLETTGSSTFGSYVHIPTSVFVALSFKHSIGRKPKRKKPLFEQAYLYMGPVKSWEGGYGYYMKIYGLAFAASIMRKDVPEPIPEAMIREALR